MLSHFLEGEEFFNGRAAWRGKIASFFVFTGAQSRSRESAVGGGYPAPPNFKFLCLVMGPFFSNHQRVMKNDGTEVTLQLPLTTAGEWRFKSEGRHRRAWMDRRGWLGSGSSRGEKLLLVAAGCRLRSLQP